MDFSFHFLSLHLRIGFALLRITEFVKFTKTYHTNTLEVCKIFLTLSIINSTLLTLPIETDVRAGNYWRST